MSADPTDIAIIRAARIRAQLAKQVEPQVMQRIKTEPTVTYFRSLTLILCSAFWLWVLQPFWSLWL